MGDRYFESRAEFREWLSANHESPDELWVGFYKKASGKPSITYHEALDECLCFGWIDGVRHAVDEERYRQRFTKRRKGSVWSAVNIRRMEALIEQGLVKAPGLAAYEARDPAKTQQFEQRSEGLSPEYEQRFKAQKQAWAFFEEQAPWYRRTTSLWVMSAKQEATRERRLQQLIDDSAVGLWIAPVRQARGSRDSAPA